jgi:hypothetical protein
MKCGSVDLKPFRPELCPPAYDGNAVVRRMEIEMVRRFQPVDAGLLWASSALAAEVSILNESYDPTREL